MSNSGGVAFDNLYTWDGCTLLSMAESPLKEGVIWVGTNDGLLHLSRDSGKNWANLTARLPKLPPGGSVSCIEPSTFAEGTCYVSFRFIYTGDFRSYIYKTTDFGQNWTSVVGDLPQSQSSTVYQIKEDPGQRGLLFAGTDNALYFSPNDGGHWIRLRGDLPPAPVFGIAIQPRFRDLVLGTYGRGFYILDDITPLRGQPLSFIRMQRSKVTDVAPLAECVLLEEIILPENARNVELLRRLPRLRRIATTGTPDYHPTQSAEEFWKAFDAVKK
jgi:photosystem II stability/assembly factor-like uncharacterized protein